MLSDEQTQTCWFNRSVYIRPHYSTAGYVGNVTAISPVRNACARLAVFEWRIHSSIIFQNLSISTWFNESTVLSQHPFRQLPRVIPGPLLSWSYWVHSLSTMIINGVRKTNQGYETKGKQIRLSSVQQRYRPRMQGHVSLKLDPFELGSIEDLNPNLIVNSKKVSDNRQQWQKPSDNSKSSLVINNIKFLLQERSTTFLEAYCRFELFYV